MISKIRFKNALGIASVLFFVGAILMAPAPCTLAEDTPATSSGILPLPDIGFAQAQRLEGKWVRQDGGYRLVIEDVKLDGSLKASYFNPGKINVSISNWKFENERLHIFIELRDTNYPGSTYSLVYAKEQEVLEGTYFQAVTKESYSISFLRIAKDQN